ncbi:polysaccharide pyruvyl transferase family protein [Mucilaginibacter terrae]|uniref:polysaccharide pyruvyl transferase family protein n=1 Tax=Mucilaginibacter terrae TaxID=1955052 RepID=UPI0036399A69
MSKDQIKHISRNVQQRLFPIPVGVIGGYHGGNLGDMALGKSVIDRLTANHIRSGLQTIYNLEKWPLAKKAIVGGGAVGYADSLSRVAKRYKGNYQNVALLGVDFNETSYPQDCLDLIRNAAFVSGRSKVQADKLKEITGREVVYNHPDIAFSLINDYCEMQRKAQSPTKKKMLVNVVPLYADIKDGVISSVERYRAERPELYQNFDLMHQSYKQIIRDLVNEALQQGHVVESIAFTPADRDYAMHILEGLPVKHHAYHSEVDKMIKYMATADWIVATRFHATIFALKLGVKLSPIAYASKNERMLEELGVDRSTFLSTGDLAGGNTKALRPVKVESEKINSWEKNTVELIDLCIKQLYQK